jgi:hypothetical protein
MRRLVQRRRIPKVWRTVASQMRSLSAAWVDNKVPENVASGRGLPCSSLLAVLPNNGECAQPALSFEVFPPVGQGAQKEVTLEGPCEVICVHRSVWKALACFAVRALEPISS